MFDTTARFFIAQGTGSGVTIAGRGALTASLGTSSGGDEAVAILRYKVLNG